MFSKKLDHDDESGFAFIKRALGGDATAAINFDRLQKHPKYGYIIFELLKCGESQSVTPYTSHPNRYWNKNAAKFLALWRAKIQFHATLYLVNYADEGTPHENEVLVINVLAMDEHGITNETVQKLTFDSFSTWFRRMNKECLTPKKDIIKDIYENESVEELGQIVMKFKMSKHFNKSFHQIYQEDKQYLYWLSQNENFEFSKAAGIYLKKMKELQLSLKTTD